MADAATTVRRRGVAAKLRRGALPQSNYERAVVARGCGRACDACDEPVAWPQIEIAARLGPRRTLYFHVDCFGIWRVTAQALAKRARRGAQADEEPDGAPVSGATAGSATPPPRPATAGTDRSPTP